MAKRIAALMEMHSVHPSLVINVDQTGVKLVPSSAFTYEKCNSSSVAVIRVEDKRQITACLASALSGELPLCSSSFRARPSARFQRRLLPPLLPCVI
jgi:hypothetical protein